jgi:phospholipase/carboxylesterase
MTTPLIVEPIVNADACVIWLHGLGANRYDFEPVAHEIHRQNPAIRFVFPQAPVRPVTVNGGLAMPSWYDILAMSPTSRAIDEDEINESAHEICALIQQQLAEGIPARRIFLVGFSQGGAVVLHTAYHVLDAAIGGVIALSTYGPTLDRPLVSSNQDLTPALFMHGTRDQVVTLPFGRMAHDRLAEQGVPTSWVQYEIDHEVTLVEVKGIENWISARLDE